MQVPPPPPPVTVPPPPMVSTVRGRRTGLAALVALVGVAVGLAMMLLAGLARAATVEGFARAPVGCTTTLQFDRAGVFTVYLETRGTVDAVDGDCSLNGTSYDHQSDGLMVTTELTASDGTEVAVESVDLTRRYDTGTFRGTSIGVARVPAAGEYRLAVSSEADDIVVAVGGAPDADSRMLQVAGLVVAALGLLGGVLIASTGRRKAPPTAPRPVIPVVQERPTLPTTAPQWGPPSV